MTGGPRPTGPPRSVTPPIPSRNFLAKTLAAAAGAALLFFILSAPGKKGLAPGSPAPVFALTDIGGRTISLSDYKGKVLLVDFWATWCGSCEEDVPELKALYQEFERGQFGIVAASVDEGGPELVARYAAEHALPYPVVFAGEDTTRDYRIFGLPTKFLIDPKGRIYRKYLADVSREEIASDIRSLLSRRDS